MNYFAMKFSNVLRYSNISWKETALIRWDHVLNVDVGIFATISFHELKCFLNHVTDIVVILLRIVDSVTQIFCYNKQMTLEWWVLTVIYMCVLTVSVSEQIHYRQYLAIVRHESLSHCLRWLDQQLDLLEGLDHNILTLSLQCTLDRDN